MEEAIAKKYRALSGLLNEPQSRLWASSEAMCLGRGGVSTVARATGLFRPIISKGIKELKTSEHLAEKRVRREGAGREKVIETQREKTKSRNFHDFAYFAFSKSPKSTQTVKTIRNRSVALMFCSVTLRDNSFMFHIVSADRQDVCVDFEG